MGIVDYEATLRLAGDFENGWYTLFVNDYVLDLTLPLSAPPDDGTSATTVPRYTVIENVEVIVLESYPMQLHLRITGYSPDGCVFPVGVDQWREDHRVFVEITREIDPEELCPAMVVPYETTIPLEGGFESGTYTIYVNDYMVELEL